MKKIVFAAPALVALGVLASSNAGAGPQAIGTVAHSGGTGPLTWLFTNAKGTIKVPAGAKLPGPSGQVAATCADITVTATSKEMKPAPSGGGFVVQSPKWSNAVKASGNLSSGSCSYLVTVSANSDFVLVPTGSEPSHVACNYLDAVSSPAQAGWFKVAAGSSKVQDFTVSDIACIILH